MLHEALAYQVYDAMGVKVPGAGYARLKVNGQPYGLYLNLESPDVHFLQRHFGDHGGILYEGAYGVDLRRAGGSAGRRQAARTVRCRIAPGSLSVTADPRWSIPIRFFT